jgi:hypothetical protein
MARKCGHQSQRPTGAGFRNIVSLENHMNSTVSLSVQQSFPLVVETPTRASYVVSADGGGGAFTLAQAFGLIAPSDLTAGGAAAGQFLAWNGSAWGPAVLPIASSTAPAGVVIADGTTVAISGTGVISVPGIAANANAIAAEAARAEAAEAAVAAVASAALPLAGGTMTGWPMLPAGAPPAAQAAASRNYVDTSIAASSCNTVNLTATGNADDVQINAAITAMSAAGGGTVRLAVGTFDIQAQINGASGVTLTGVLGGTILSANALLARGAPSTPDTWGNVINACNCTNFTVSNLTIQGNYAAQSGQTTVAANVIAAATIPVTSTAGILPGQFVWVAGQSLGVVTVSAVTPGVSITVSAPVTLTSGATLTTTVTGGDNGGNCIRFDGCHDCGAANVEVTGAYAHGIFINDASGSSDGMSLSNIYAHGNGQIGIHIHANNPSAYHPWDFSVNGVWCTNNAQVAVVPYNGFSRQYGGIFCSYYGDRYGSLTRIWVFGERGPGFTLKGRTAASTGAPASMMICSGIFVHGCGTDNASEAQAANIYIGDSLGQAVLNDFVSEGATQDGVYFDGASPGAVGPIWLTNGIIRNNLGSGVTISSTATNDINIVNCDLSTNRGYGVQAFPASGSKHFRVQSCTIVGNWLYAISFSNVAYLKILDNSCRLNSGGGVSLTSVSDFQVRGNTLLDDVANLWTPATVVAAGFSVQNGGNVYLYDTGGTTASSGGPTGTNATVGGIVDGTATCHYAGIPAKSECNIGGCVRGLIQGNTIGLDTAPANGAGQISLTGNSYDLDISHNSFKNAGGYPVLCQGSGSSAASPIVIACNRGLAGPSGYMVRITSGDYIKSIYNTGTVGDTSGSLHNGVVALP